VTAHPPYPQHPCPEQAVGALQILRADGAAAMRRIDGPLRVSGTTIRRTPPTDTLAILNSHFLVGVTISRQRLPPGVRYVDFRHSNQFGMLRPSTNLNCVTPATTGPVMLDGAISPIQSCGNLH
jgi:hypothetical protein